MSGEKDRRRESKGGADAKAKLAEKTRDGENAAAGVNPAADTAANVGVKERTAAEVEPCAENVKETEKVYFGKFRNPEELARAYAALEREFTRRSQRLAEAERALGEREAEYDPDGPKWKVTVEKFFGRIPSARPFAADMAEEIAAHPELRGERDCLYRALVGVLAAKFRTPEQLLSDGQFLKEYVLASDTVKKAVIGSYLEGLRAGMPPAVMRGGGQSAPAPTNNPRSIEEAGRLFLKENK